MQINKNYYVLNTDNKTLQVARLTGYRIFSVVGKVPYWAFQHTPTNETYYYLETPEGEQICSLYLFDTEQEAKDYAQKS